MEVGDFRKEASIPYTLLFLRFNIAAQDVFWQCFSSCIYMLCYKTLHHDLFCAYPVHTPFSSSFPRPTTESKNLTKIYFPNTLNGRDIIKLIQSITDISFGLALGCRIRENF